MSSAAQSWDHSRPRPGFALHAVGILAGDLIFVAAGIRMSQSITATRQDHIAPPPGSLDGAVALANSRALDVDSVLVVEASADFDNADNLYPASAIRRAALSHVAEALHVSGWCRDSAKLLDGLFADDEDAASSGLAAAAAIRRC